jgi:hypothetical protein
MCSSARLKSFRSYIEVFDPFSVDFCIEIGVKCQSSACGYRFPNISY